MKTLIFAATVVMQVAGEDPGKTKIDVEGPFYTKQICINSYLGQLKSEELANKIKRTIVFTDAKHAGKLAVQAVDIKTGNRFALEVYCKAFQLQ